MFFSIDWIDHLFFFFFVLISLFKNHPLIFLNTLCMERNSPHREICRPFHETQFHERAVTLFKKTSPPADLFVGSAGGWFNSADRYSGVFLVLFPFW